MTKAAVTVRGVVEEIFYSSPRFSAGRLRTADGSAISFAGPAYVRRHEQLILRGPWKRHPIYGPQIAVESVEYDMELDVDGLAHYLANHPDIKGIGPAKARVIAETFGRDFDHAIQEAPESVARAAGLSEEAVTNLRAQWLKTHGLNRTKAMLAGHGLTHHQIQTVVERLGNSAPAVLRDDPYSIVREVPGLGFKRVDQIARKIGTPKEHDSRLRAGVLYCVEEALDDGDTCVEHESLVREANQLLVLDDLDSESRIGAAVDGLVSQGKLVRIALCDRIVIARPDLRQMEEEIAGWLERAASLGPHVRMVNAAVSPDTRLNDGQQVAVEVARRNRVSLITGGAGTGKTFVVAAIHRTCTRSGLGVVLAAPTGKAAKRLEEVVGSPASTIHRLLGYNGRTYTAGPDSPIDADVVIIDEVSMVDVPLLWQFLRAIDVGRTAVVLVGDPHQLPPVGPGYPLRDILASRAVPTTVLDHVVRQAGVLKDNSTAILRGDVRETSDIGPAGRRAWCVIDQFQDQWDVWRFVLELFGGLLADRFGFDEIADVQLLTPTHRGPLGTVALNTVLQQIIQKRRWGVEVPATRQGRLPRPRVRDRVIQTRNNYQLGVMNGTIGTVTRVDSDGGMEIEFDGRRVEIRAGSEDRRDIQLAYALTVHKAQGSEFPCAVVIAHKAHAFMHHRNLLYTAVTRAQETVILIGDRWGMRNCARRRQLESRRTLLPALLGQRAAEGPTDSPDVRYIHE